MKERPILFSGEMVKAILEGRKTQTRRIKGLERINGRPYDWAKAVMLSDGTWSFWYPGGKGTEEFAQKAYPNGGGIRCPYGNVGDRLWVRETFAINDVRYYNPIPKVRPCDLEELIYRSDGEMREQFEQCDGYLEWRPSIHMPRWASRITLEITSIRVERLQDISEQDVKAEGTAINKTVPALVGAIGDTATHEIWIPPVGAFAGLWNLINAGRGYAWHTNPWVWVIEFNRKR